MREFDIEVSIYTRDEVPPDIGGRVVVRAIYEGEREATREWDIDADRRHVSVAQIISNIRSAVEQIADVDEAADGWSIPLTEPEREITANVSLGRLKRARVWDRYCSWSGTSYFGPSTGTLGDDREVRVPVSKLKEWGIL